VGQSISVGLAGAIFVSLGGAAAGAVLAFGRMNRAPYMGPAKEAALQQTFVDAFHTTFIVCACIAAIGVFTSLVRGQEQVRSRGN
jgi:hypothetical protein